jgi:hypothetical protein
MPADWESTAPARATAGGRTLNAKATPELNLRITLVLDIPARDYVDAAAHQTKIEALLAPLREGYPQAIFEIRDRKAAAAPTVNRGVVRTGNLHHYE